MKQLRKIETVALSGAAGPTHGIMVALDLDATDSEAAWVPELAEKLKLQFMISPPDTTLLLVTIIGPLRADALLPAWNALLAKDMVLRIFMGRLQRAAYVHGTPDGKQLAEGSLMPPAA